MLGPNCHVQCENSVTFLKCLTFTR